MMTMIKFLVTNWIEIKMLRHTIKNCKLDVKMKALMSILEINEFLLILLIPQFNIKTTKSIAKQFKFYKEICLVMAMHLVKRYQYSLLPLKESSLLELHMGYLRETNLNENRTHKPVFHFTLCYIILKTLFKEKLYFS